MLIQRGRVDPAPQGIPFIAATKRRRKAGRRETRGSSCANSSQGKILLEVGDARRKIPFGEELRPNESLMLRIPFCPWTSAPAQGQDTGLGLPGSAPRDPEALAPTSREKQNPSFTSTPALWDAAAVNPGGKAALDSPCDSHGSGRAAEFPCSPAWVPKCSHKLWKSPSPAGKRLSGQGRKENDPAFMGI